jgi:uncharacterized repeat protein (TIGR03803 family)
MGSSPIDQIKRGTHVERTYASASEFASFMSLGERAVRIKVIRFAMIACAALWVSVANFAASAQGAPSYKLHTLYNFCAPTNCSNGAGPQAGLIMDHSGNLFGTTASGGANNEGTVFELAPNGKKWTWTLLYSFCSQAGCTDGDLPSADLIEDTAGNLYGTTEGGGAKDWGTAFELTTSGNLIVLYSFCSQSNCADGNLPSGPLTYKGAASGAVYDGTSPLYGTTCCGGANNWGTVFELKPGKNGWTETVLYSFCQMSNCTDGSSPSYGGLLAEGTNSLYGATDLGGQKNVGTVFQLSHSKKQWSESVLYSFCAQTDCTDGSTPTGGLVADKAGTLYGTTYVGGTGGGGVAFKLATNSDYSVLYNFCSQTACSDGQTPYAGLTKDGAGNLFGTTTFGGINDGGTVFELNGSYTVLYSFCAKGSCTDGLYPEARLLLDKSGNIFSTTENGGQYKYDDYAGTVFELKR